MAKKENITIQDLMNKQKNIRNIGIIAHIDHGKSTLTDSILAGAGMLSRQVAGEARKTDTLEEEQKRGITIQATAVSMVHKFEDDYYLINLIDTPGHVDFGGDVTRAMRAVDGALVLVDAVEGVMPQTETVLRQAMKERVKPVLFINKVDRLLDELRLTPEEMQNRFMKIINNFNNLVYSLAPEGFKEKWQVKVQDGTVGFGSAIDKWALSFTYMKKKGISFKDVIDAYTGSEKEEKLKEFQEKIPLHEVILDMVIKHLPDPVEAQRYRIPRLWSGDTSNEVGKDLLNCNPNGKTVFVVTKVIVDPQAGEISFGRVFSGTLKAGQEVYMINANKQTKVQQLAIIVIGDRINVSEIPAGNTAAIIGLKDSSSGETLSEVKIEPFEAIKHLFEPVVTKAIEPKNPKDLPKLIKVLREISLEDPTVSVKINEESGEFLISGLGELHLEWTEQKIKKYKGVDIVTSPPIVIYRESVSAVSPEVEGKSPNKHNKLYIQVEPLEKNVLEALTKGEIQAGKVRKKDKEIVLQLEKIGMDKEEARKLRDIYEDNVFLDMTHGIVHIGEIMELCLQAFKEVMSQGPLAREPMFGVKVKLNDAKLHEDSIHRGPAQIIPAVRQAIKEAVLQAKPILFEPVQTIRIDTPNDFMGDVSKLIQSRRGKLLDMEQTSSTTTIKAKIPVSEMFGFTTKLRSETEGRASWFLMNSEFEQLPKELQDQVVKKIRERKGLKETQI